MKKIMSRWMLAVLVAAFAFGVAVQPVMTTVYAAEQGDQQQQPPQDGSQGEHSGHHHQE